MYRLIILLLFLFHTSVKAQFISGKVLGKNEKGEQENIAMANVYWQGTTIGVVADIDGNFKIPIADSLPAKLIFSSVGFNPDTLLISSPLVQEITMLLKSMVSLNEIEVEAKQSTTMNKIFTPINQEVISSKELLKSA